MEGRGLVIVDSLVYVRGGTPPYGPDQMEVELLDQHEIDARIVGIRGGVFSGGRYKAYDYVLRRALDPWEERRPAWVLLLSGGNDVYKSEPDEELQTIGVSFDIAKAAAFLAQKGIPALVIFGMSAGTWRYSGIQAAGFDRRVGKVLQITRELLPLVAPRIRIEDGVGQLVLDDNDVVDKIGHLGGGIAFMKLARAIAQWVSSLRQPRSRL